MSSLIIGQYSQEIDQLKAMEDKLYRSTLSLHQNLCEQVKAAGNSRMGSRSNSSSDDLKDYNM